MKKKPHRLSVKKNSSMRSSTFRSLLPERKDISPSKLYQSIDKIDLDRFLDVLFDGEYDRLTIEGNPDEGILKEAWNTIYLQYCELAGSGTYNEVFERNKEVQSLNARISLIDGIVKHLMLTYESELVAVLNTMGYPCDMKEGDDPEKKLKPVVARAKRLILQLEVAQKELLKVQAVEHATTGREYFDDWLDAMSKRNGFMVKAKDITVAQFCRGIKKMTEESKKIKHGRD